MQAENYHRWLLDDLVLPREAHGQKRSLLMAKRSTGRENKQLEVLNVRQFI